MLNEFHYEYYNNSFQPNVIRDSCRSQPTLKVMVGKLA